MNDNFEKDTNADITGLPSDIPATENPSSSTPDEVSAEPAETVFDPADSSVLGEQPGSSFGSDVFEASVEASPTEGSIPESPSPADNPPTDNSYSAYNGAYNGAQGVPTGNSQPNSYYTGSSSPNGFPPRQGAAPGGFPPMQGNAPYINHSPYSDFSRTNQPYPAAPPVKKKKNGIKAFFVALVAVLIVAAIFIGIAVTDLISNRDNDIQDNSPAINDYEGNNSNDSDNNAPDELVTKASGNTDSDKSYAPGTVLTPSQVADKASSSVAVILVYQNDSLVGSGSGVLWTQSADGKYTYVITCAHVVSTAGIEVIVQLDDGTQCEAVEGSISYDKKTDLAVLKIEETGLNLAEFGDSSALDVGDPVYAIGSPGGSEYSNSFTQGVISAINRSVTSTYTMEYIQHDAAINPGNSGGALINEYGQVVGINSMKIVDEEYEGMGFAIPISSASEIVTSLAKHGYVPNRPQLGITYTSVSASWTYSFLVNAKGLPQGSLIIYGIDSNSALTGTKARQYDLITAVDGKELDSADVLLDKIESSNVGDTLTLTLCRVIDQNYNIETFDVKVTLIEDKGNGDDETTTSGYSFNPYDYGNYGY